MQPQTESSTSSWLTTIRKNLLALGLSWDGLGQHWWTNSGGASFGVLTTQRSGILLWFCSVDAGDGWIWRRQGWFGTSRHTQLFSWQRLLSDTLVHKGYSLGVDYLFKPIEQVLYYWHRRWGVFVEELFQRGRRGKTTNSTAQAR